MAADSWGELYQQLISVFGLNERTPSRNFCVRRSFSPAAFAMYGPTTSATDSYVGSRFCVGNVPSNGSPSLSARAKNSAWLATRLRNFGKLTYRQITVSSGGISPDDWFATSAPIP